MPQAGVPRITVLVVTYNHEAYIRQAIESVLMQRLAEPYLVVVADDASSDGTRAIIKELFDAAGSDAPTMQFLDHAANLGVTRNYQRAFAACETDYVAVIEGDDYWITPGKLAVQLAFLDTHRECAAVSANHFVYDEAEQRYAAKSLVNSEFSYLDARSLIDNNLIGNFSTCMYRLSALKALPKKLFAGTAYDWGVNICVARNALIGYLHTPLSVYRVHNGGTWSSMEADEQLEAQLRVIDHYDAVTDRNFQTEFKDLQDRLELSLRRSGSWRPWLPRATAVLYACVPPFVILGSRWIGRKAVELLVPPILPIALRKYRAHQKGRI
jgi:glycosyltransferase involved in cell wall biosynthesis